MMAEASLMKILQKFPDKDFVILNLTDPQLSDAEWAEGQTPRRVLEYTVNELVARTKPDLITVSGDLAWAGNHHAYDCLADLLDGCGVPWSFVWGNHDQQTGQAEVERVVERYLQRPLCLYERGDAALGNGNFVLLIEQEGQAVQALLMMDSHDREAVIDQNGETQEAWAKLTAPQLAWYRQQVAALRDRGCRDAALLLHIPPHAYRLASEAALKDQETRGEVTIAESMTAKPWNVGYGDSIGVQWEPICSYPSDDGVLATIKECGLTTHVLAGHDHRIATMISYEGIRWIYALKTGMGCYWTPALNGGTVLTVSENGLSDARYEYVDASSLL